MKTTSTSILLLSLALLASAQAATSGKTGVEPVGQVDSRVDQSIERGLAYLVSGQNADGSFNSGPGSQYTGIPGLCGMAFLAKGYLPGSGKYGENINRVVDFLVSKAAADGYLGGNEGRMYSHCISTLFLTEVSGMVDSNRQAKLDVLLPKAIQVILSAQQVLAGLSKSPAPAKA